MKAALPLLPLLLLAGLSGCADMFHGSTQKVTVQTASNNVALAGAQCALSNKKGQWLVTTPGTTTVHRGSEPLQVNCTKDGYQPGTYAASSSPYIGEIILGGGIGAAVDTSSGAAWGYPDTIVVPMQPATAAATAPAPTASLTN